MDIEDVKKKIDSMGNMRVIFEPTVFKSDRIHKKQLLEILEKSQVSLRGWSFPHLPRENRDDTKRPYSIGNGIESYTDWERETEVFNFFQSGQFIAKFALLEDTLGELYGNELEPGKYLDFLSLIYKVTEICLFIRNLVENTDIEGGKLIIEINKTKNRQLESLFSHQILPLMGDYVCHLDTVSITRNFDRERILFEHTGIAFEFIREIFGDFNWNNYSEKMILTHQENLLTRRI
jgi:hypothetical protein